MTIYDIKISKVADKKLKSLNVTDRSKIAELIYLLGQNPNHVGLDIKKIVGESQGYILRVGKWRIVFEKDDLIKIIFIEKIGARGGIYK